jgi:hypothetical protein
VAAASNNPLSQIPVSGTLTTRSGHQVGTLTGTFTVTHFAQQHGALVAQGVFTGTVSNTAGTVTRTVTVPVTVPVSFPSSSSGTTSNALAAADPTCNVLNLTLGPIDLNLLGLMLHVNQVVVNITANPAGGLLGQLLCSLAGQSSLSQVVNLLNQILGILQGL